MHLNAVTIHSCILGQDYVSMHTIQTLIRFFFFQGKEHSIRFYLLGLQLVYCWELFLVNHTAVSLLREWSQVFSICGSISDVNTYVQPLLDTASMLKDYKYR